MEIRVEERPDAVWLRPQGRLDHHTVPALLTALKAAQKSGARIGVDASGLTAIDTAGAATLWSMTHPIKGAPITLYTAQLQPAVAAMLGALPEPDATSTVPVAETPGLFETLGESGYGVLHQSREMLYLVSDTFHAAVVGPFKGQRMPPGALVDQGLRLGMNALPIVGLIALLLGLIMAFQAAFQLRQFGANIFVADLVSISMTRELGPLMTAILMAGRSGSAISAELGTMKVSEEIDALRTMGLDPVSFLVVPRFWAVTLSNPALTLYAIAISLTGGFIIAVAYLDLSASAYINQSLKALSVDDLVMGMTKSLVFAWIIVFSGCYTGLSIRGGASSVGQATTRSVVGAIFAIIVADSVFTTASTLLE